MQAAQSELECLVVKREVETDAKLVAFPVTDSLSP